MEIELDKESIFTLEMKIDGEVSSAEPPQMRFSIIKESLTFSLIAKRIDNGIYEITIPKLKNIFEAGEYQANIEVFIDGKHFVPLKETVKLKQEIKPTVKISESVKNNNQISNVLTVDKIEIKRPTIKKLNESMTVTK